MSTGLAGIQLSGITDICQLFEYTWLLTIETAPTCAVTHGRLPWKLAGFNSETMDSFKLMCQNVTPKF